MGLFCIWCLLFVVGFVVLLLLFGCLGFFFVLPGVWVYVYPYCWFVLDVGLFGLMFVVVVRCSFGFIVACRLMFRFGFVVRWWFGFCRLCLLLVDFGWFWCLCMLCLLCIMLGVCCGCVFDVF